MIIFNGTALESIAPVKIEDIRVSPIQMTATARQRPVRWGADFVRMTGGTRTVAITFGLLTEDRDARMSQILRIAKWARTDEPAPLLLPNYIGKYLPVVCTALPEPSTRQWWESKLRIVFTAFEPYFVGVEEKSCATGTEFTVLGDAPPLMQIRATVASALSNQAFSDGTNTMTFSTVPAGALVIDLNHQTAAVDGSSIMSNYSFVSDFLPTKTGAQTITGVGTVFWHERWE